MHAYHATCDPGMTHSGTQPIDVNVQAHALAPPF